MAAAKKAANGVHANGATSSKATTPAAAYIASPRTTEYEFAGPLGALGVTLGVPFFSYWLSTACTAEACPPWPWHRFVEWHVAGFKSATSDPAWWKAFWSWQAAGVYGAWYAWTVVCWFVLPGKMIQGQEMRNGERKTYCMNAFATLVVTLAALGGATYIYGLEPLLFVHENWTQLVTAAIAGSFLQGFLVFAQSYQKNEMLALGGNTPNHFYNFFIGRSLNPSIGALDLKSFNELRPGMILWLLIDLSLAAKQYLDLGKVEDSMVLVVAFHSWYIVDALFNESAILSTMDITTDGYGLMLAIGDNLWVPFTYSYQAWFLSQHAVHLGVTGIAGVLAVQLTGYYIFRTSNNEKNLFRQGQNPKGLKFLQTQRGTKLLVSGWWGRSRHPNYMGDWLMAWAWCLPCGFSTPLPYFYPVYFAILLVHRAQRDDHACKHKYGADWATYKKLVPYRIIPYVY